MNNGATTAGEIQTASRRLAKGVLSYGENRLQLLLLEVEEERERLLQALLFALGMAAFGLLAGVAFTLLVLLACWKSSPVLAMVVLTLVYGAGAVFFGMRLVALRRDWEAFSGSLSQIKKDCSCLAGILD